MLIVMRKDASDADMTRVMDYIRTLADRPQGKLIRVVEGEIFDVDRKA